MGNSKYTGTLVGSDGSKLTILDAELTPASGHPPIDPPIQTPNTVRIGTVTYPLSGINPTSTSNPPGALFPGARGPDQLVVYLTPLTVTETNIHGFEVPVTGGVAGNGTVNQTLIPADGYVLSGHGLGMEFLLTNASAGAKVELIYLDKPVDPPGPPATSTGSNISVWVMMWSNSPRVDIGALPLEVDEVRLSFMNGTGQMVGSGPFGLDTLKSQLQTFLKARKGRFVSISLGGGGYDINLSNVAGWVNNILAAENTLGITFGGMNWDWETGGFKQSATNVIALSRAMKKLRPDFYISWSPNGSYKWDYRDVCNSAPDVVSEVGFQNYDVSVSYDTALSIMREFQKNGKIMADQLGVAMMIQEPADSKHWTLAQCVDYMTRLRAATGSRRVALWEGGRPKSVEWYKAMKGIVS